MSLCIELYLSLEQPLDFLLWSPLTFPFGLKLLRLGFQSLTIKADLTENRKYKRPQAPMSNGKSGGGGPLS